MLKKDDTQRQRGVTWNVSACHFSTSCPTTQWAALVYFAPLPGKKEDGFVCLCGHGSNSGPFPTICGPSFSRWLVFRFVFPLRRGGILVDPWKLFPRLRDQPPCSASLLEICSRRCCLPLAGGVFLPESHFFFIVKYVSAVWFFVFVVSVICDKHGRVIFMSRSWGQFSILRRYFPCLGRGSFACVCCCWSLF